MRNKDFFVSYTQADGDAAQRIAATLKAAGFSTVMQSRDFHPGGRPVEDIDAALGQCRYFIAVVSKDYVESVWCKAEWQAWLHADLQADQRHLITVRVGPCTPGKLLQSIHYVDLVGVSDEQIPTWVQAMPELIDEAFLECPFYGARQMVRHLRRLGWQVGRKRVSRLMRKRAGPANLHSRLSGFSA